MTKEEIKTKIADKIVCCEEDIIDMTIDLCNKKTKKARREAKKEIYRVASHMEAYLDCLTLFEIEEK